MHYFADFAADAQQTLAFNNISYQSAQQANSITFYNVHTQSFVLSLITNLNLHSPRRCPYNVYILLIGTCNVNQHFKINEF